MPELPDVELFRRVVGRHARHRAVSRVVVRSSKVLGGISGRSLDSAVRGRQFTMTVRRGKHLFIELSDVDRALHVHFGMSGSFVIRDDGDSDGRFDRVVFGFNDGGRLCYVSKRQLGAISVVHSVEQAIEELALGPDALAITADDFDELVRSAGGMVKSLLMDQEKIAGVGNIYSDEILFQAGIHPKARCDSLDKRARKKLWRSMRRVLEMAIDRDAQPNRMPSSFLLPHRTPGEPCPRCGGKVSKVSVSGRSSYVCARCQPAP
ncbi:MAG: Fpg/Nei family DNA glycosylase [Chitinivibrionales bacterium]|nr:Fpg/Nei family DNA glycosylase [Chitinivibrionales bacterium]